jgi:hypothetical protein
MTPEELKRFDEASNHPYECKCAICKEWWSLVPLEDEDDLLGNGDTGEDTNVEDSYAR